MQILINRLTNKVEGINIPLTPFNYVIDIDDSLNPSKEMEVQEGDKHKTNKEGKVLYEHKVYKTVTEELIVGKEEVTEETENPVLIVVQKTDEEGKELYLESVYDEETEELVDCIEVVNAFSKKGFRNEPIFIEVHKTNEEGEFLYYKDKIEIVEKEVLDYIEEVTENIIVTKWETIINKIPQVVGVETVIDEITGEETTIDKIEEVDVESQVIKDFIKLEPIMIPNMVMRTFDLKTNFERFDVEDILHAKYQHILEESQKDYIIGDMFIDETDLDLEDEKHSANTGLAILQLLPKGQAKTKNIELSVDTKEFKLLEFVADEGVEIYLSGKRFTDEKLTLPNSVSSCTIKFINTTDKPKSVKSYAIGY